VGGVGQNNRMGILTDLRRGLAVMIRVKATSGFVGKATLGPHLGCIRVTTLNEPGPIGEERTHVYSPCGTTYEEHNSLNCLEQGLKYIDLVALLLKVVK